MNTRRRFIVLCLALIISISVAGSQKSNHVSAQAIDNVGAAIYVAGDETGNVDIFSFDRRAHKLDSFNVDFTTNDRLAIGDVTGDGIDEILVAGDHTGNIDIFDQVGHHLGSFNGSFTGNDGFAVGDVDRDGIDEILIAGDTTGNIDIFDYDPAAHSGHHLGSFNGSFTGDDGFAVGDVDGDGIDEILIAGDTTGNIDIFWAEFNMVGVVGHHLGSFNGSFTEDDGFAVGDVNGDGIDEILVAGNDTENIDIFGAEFTMVGVVGHHLGSFDGHFTDNDGFAVGRHTYPDQDGDGLLDQWETYGVSDPAQSEDGAGPNTCGDGIDNGSDGAFDGTDSDCIILDLHALGANPNPKHKDLFLELDYVAGQTPSRAAIQAVKAAFAAAPLNNPDGTTGVNLWVDTGNLVDPSAREGQALGTCLDGIDNGRLDGAVDTADLDCQPPNYLETSTEDPGPANCNDAADNDGDGLIDGTDPDCLVGDNLGGGNFVIRPIGCLVADFYITKENNFNLNRRSVFRYAISGDPADSFPCAGGRGEIGGNDFIEYNHDGGTIMHELGHDLNLRHGGFEDHNCKPNYVSVMNYDDQFGIQRNGGGVILDYSPPRIDFNGKARGVAPLPSLVEDNLDEPFILDASDTMNQFVFANASGQKIPNSLNVPPDWNNDGDPPFETNLTVDIDIPGANGQPAKCAKNLMAPPLFPPGTLLGSDDWSKVSLPFRGFGDSDGGAINPVDEPEPTLHELNLLQQELNTTDLGISLTDSPDPVAAGTPLTYTVTVVNHGPTPANSVQVVDTLPTGVAYLRDTVGCMASPPNTLTCNLGSLMAGASGQVVITVLVDANLVSTAGGPTVISNQVTVENLAGPDPDLSNNSASEDTQVEAVADLAIVSFQAVNPPADVLVGKDVAITLKKVITNNGPSAPIDVELTKSAVAPLDSTVAPTSATSQALALNRGEQREVLETFTIHCGQPGQHTFTFANEIGPLHPEDTDPDRSNNFASLDLNVDCVVPVTINIKPGEYPNSINPGSQGLTPVAVLTTLAGEYGNPLAFDATLIDPLSVRFGTRAAVWAETGGAFAAHGTGHIEDSRELDETTRDRDLDMVLQFLTRDTGIRAGDVEACIKGEWIDRNGRVYKFFGCDSVKVSP
jgi:uncharacterized repeat protein (TIGR01451 family)